MTLDLDGIERAARRLNETSAAINHIGPGTYAKGSPEDAALGAWGQADSAYGNEVTPEIVLALVGRLRAAERVCAALSAQTDAANGDKGSLLMTDYWKATEQLEAAHEAWLRARGEG
jgi:hypothetical protein